MSEATEVQPIQVIDLPVMVTINYKGNDCVLFNQTVSLSASLDPTTGEITGTLHAPAGVATGWFFHLADLQSDDKERLSMWAELKKGLTRAVNTAFKNTLKLPFGKKKS